MSIKVGIFLPRADMFPTLGMDVVKAIKFAIDSEIGDLKDITFITEGIGQAADNSVVEKAEKLIIQEDISLLVAFCGSHILESLTRLMTAYKKPLIHIDLGGHVIKKEQSSPYVIHLNMNLWQSAYAAGMYAAQNIGDKALVCASFYDGGYHLTASFVQGFTDHGGTVKNYYVSPMDYKSESYDRMMALMAEEDIDLVFAIFSYKEGQKVFEILSGSEYNGKIPVLAIPLMTDETMNPDNYNIQLVSSIASWSFDEETDAMQSFVKRYAARFEEDPNVMNLLGFEVGLMISECLMENDSIPKQIGTYFSTRSIKTPRGTIRFNERNESEVDTFKIRQFNYNQVKYHNTVVGSLEVSAITDGLYDKLGMLPDPTWKNPYICT